MLTIFSISESLFLCILITFEVHAIMHTLDTSFLKKRKIKRFKYTPRSYRENDLGDRSEKESRTSDFSAKWNQVRGLNAGRKNRGFSMRLLILILALLLIALYILDVKFM